MVYSESLAETIKLSVIWDKNIFQFHSNLNRNVLHSTIKSDVA